MSDHVLKAAEEYEKVVGARYVAGATQAQHYQVLLHADAKPLQKLGDTFLARFKRHDADPDRAPRGCPGTELDNIVGNYMRIPDSLNAGLRNHAFYIVHNMLYVGARFKGEDAEEKSRSCTFCGHLDETVAHVFCECVCTRSAMRLLLEHADGSVRKLGSALVEAKADDFLLRSPDLPRAKLVPLLVFAHAVWRARWTASEGGLSQALIARLAAANFVSFYRHRFRWHIRDRQLEKEVFLAVLQSLPRDSVFVYTDGSSFGNPGPAGSGFAIFDGAAEIGHGSFPLGIATNAYAEVHGVAKATEYLVKLDSDKPIYIFVDNRQAIALATGTSDAAWCQQEVGLTRRNLEALASRSRVSFFWVPGHAGVEGNERVDKLAKAGARGRSSVFLSPSRTWTGAGSAELVASPEDAGPAPRSGPLGPPAKPEAAATMPSAPPSLGSGQVSPLPPVSSVEGVSAAAASFALPPAPPS
ncbi:MAG: RNase H family protein, partial [Promethearchaeia archaeon]